VGVPWDKVVVVVGEADWALWAEVEAIMIVMFGPGPTLPIHLSLLSYCKQLQTDTDMKNLHTHTLDISHPQNQS